MSKKLPYKYQLLSIFVAGLMVGGVILYIQLVVLGQDPSLSANPRNILGISKVGEDVEIPQQMTECIGNEQCIVVDTTCSFCCKYVAINQKYEEAFNQRFDQNCAGYGGQTCKCFDLGSFPKCVSGKCKMIEWEENNTAQNDIYRPIE